MASPWSRERSIDTDLLFSKAFKKGDHTLCSSLGSNVLRVTPSPRLELTCAFYLVHLPGSLASSAGPAVLLSFLLIFTPLPYLTSFWLILSPNLTVFARPTGKRKVERHRVPGERCNYSWCQPKGKLQSQPPFSLITPPGLGDMRMCVRVHTYLHMLPEVAYEGKYVKSWKGIYFFQ